MVLENQRSREQPSKNSLVSFGGKTKKKRAGSRSREQLKKKKRKHKEIRLIFYASENVIHQHVCALQLSTLKCVKSWLFASNSVSLFEGFTGLKRE